MQGREGLILTCAPDIGKPILLADAVAIIDYYLDPSTTEIEPLGEKGPLLRTPVLECARRSEEALN